MMDVLVNGPVQPAARLAVALKTTMKPRLLSAWRRWALMLLAVATLSTPASAALTVTCPANRSPVSTTPTTCDAIVNYPAAAASGGTGAVSITYDPPSGSRFPLGVTTVTVTATDSATPTPQTATCTFTVTVRD